MIVIQICVALLLAVVAESATSASCQSFSFATITEALSTTCHGAVDYKFYVPAGQTLQYLETTARAKLNNTRLSIFPTSCQTALKRLVCGSVYLKCPYTVQVGNTSTYNYGVYSDVGLRVGVPFQRPCKSICTPVSSQCLGLLSLFGLSPNCNARYDYSGGAVPLPLASQPFQYDTNASNCNAVTASFSVAGTKEPYFSKTSGACAGIITGDVFVPPGQSLPTPLAPMQAPYQVQIAIDQQLKAALAQVQAAPAAIIPGQCFYNFRKYLCSTALMSPHYQSLGVVLKNYLPTLGALGFNKTAIAAHSFYLPSYPNRSICLDYAGTCAILASFRPDVAPKCSAVDSAGVTRYPFDNQTIISIPLTLGANTVTIPLKSPPNTLSSAVNTNPVFTAASAPGSCQTFPTDRMSKVQLVCSGAVDYPYFLPSAYTAERLNQLALSRLNNSRVSILPNACQVAMKKLVCASVYLKCQPNVDLANTLTWNYDIYKDLGAPVPVPFQRPCKSLCTNVVTGCLGLLALFKLTPDCNGKFDYSSGAVTLGNPFQFDAKNDASVCNAAPATVAVASTREPYMAAASGACSGIATELWVPPGNLVPGANLAPMQAPGVVQTIVEGKLSEQFSALPVWLDNSCRFALRKYFCGSYMLAPQKQVMGEVFASNGLTDDQVNLLQGLGINVPAVKAHTFYLPSYPDQEICQEYATTCAKFIDAAGLAALVPDCSSLSSSGSIAYPTANQTIATLPLSIPVTVPNVGVVMVQKSVNFVTQPNKMLTASDTSTSDPICPPGFVIPDDPTNKLVVWVPGSACALACYRSPVWTHQEWIEFEELTTSVSSIGFVLVIIMLIIWLSDKSRRKQYLVILFGFSSLLVTLTFIIQAAHKGPDKFCRDNAVGLSAEDGPNFCAAQSVLLVFSGLCCCTSWCMLAVDVFVKVVLGKSTAGYAKYYVPFIVIIPLIGALCGIGMQTYGFGSRFEWCFMSNSLDYPQDSDIAYFYLPVLIITFVGVSCMFAVIFSIFKTLFNTTRHRENDIVSSGPAESSRSDRSAASSAKVTHFVHNLYVVRTPFVFVVLCLLCWITLFAYRGNSYRNDSTVRDSIKEWTKCVFRNFRGSADDYLSVCGPHSKERYDKKMISWVMFCVSGQSIFVSIVYLPAILIKWFSKYFLGLFGVSSMEYRSSKSGIIKESSFGDSSHKSKKSVKSNKYFAPVDGDTADGAVPNQDEGSARGSHLSTRFVPNLENIEENHAMVSEEFVTTTNKESAGLGGFVGMTDLPRLKSNKVVPINTGFTDLDVVDSKVGGDDNDNDAVTPV